jgi:hypothetical protein
MTITPNTIITAKLLAGLDKCPFCGAKEMQDCKDYKSFKCSTDIWVGELAGLGRGSFCFTKDNTTLRARVKELEEAISFVVPVCNGLHHPLKHRHKSNETCPVESLIRKAKGTK